MDETRGTPPPHPPPPYPPPPPLPPSPVWCDPLGLKPNLHQSERLSHTQRLGVVLQLSGSPVRKSGPEPSPSWTGT